MPAEIKRSDKLDLHVYKIDDRMDIIIGGTPWTTIKVGETPKTLDLRTQLIAGKNTVEIKAVDTQPPFYSMDFEVSRTDAAGKTYTVWRPDPIINEPDHGQPPDLFRDLTYDFYLVDG